MSKVIAKHYVTDWKQAKFCSLSKVRHHKFYDGCGWQQFAETVGPAGHRSYSDVCPTWHPPSDSHAEIKEGLVIQGRGVAA